MGVGEAVTGAGGEHVDIYIYMCMYTCIHSQNAKKNANYYEELKYMISIVHWILRGPSLSREKNCSRTISSFKGYCLYLDVN